MMSDRKKSNRARLIAFYLPQFHPIKENDEWWGKGFTEWTNVGKAKALFKGHYQPRVPADLGYYDLRMAEVRKEQAAMAQRAGIEGFCYWHYWFGNGRRLLETPFNEVLSSGEPDFPFCLGWANETWSGIWHGLDKKILIEQLYPGIEDYKNHFYSLLEAFKDPRYIKVDGKPIFYIYKPFLHPEIEIFIKLWRDLAIQNNLKGFHFVGQTPFASDISKLEKLGFDAISVVRLEDHMQKKLTFFRRIYNKFLGGMKVYRYKDAYPYFVGKEERNINCIPNIIPNWDHSPRSNGRNLILHDSRPEYFGEHIDQVLAIIDHKPDENRIAFVKSWNEWGEGNYLEPDLKFGNQYLEVLRKKIVIK